MERTSAVNPTSVFRTFVTEILQCTQNVVRGRATRWSSSFSEGYVQHVGLYVTKKKLEDTIRCSTFTWANWSRALIYPPKAFGVCVVVLVELVHHPDWNGRSKSGKGMVHCICLRMQIELLVYIEQLILLIGCAACIEFISCLHFCVYLCFKGSYKYT